MRLLRFFNVFFQFVLIHNFSSILWCFPFILYRNTDYGSQELAAAALAQSLANITGMSVGVGLSTALSTLSGQSHGAASMDSHSKDRNNDVIDAEKQSLVNKKSLNSTTLYLVRGIFVAFTFVVPIGLYWLRGMKPLLIRLGQGETVSEMTEVNNVFIV